ncbi:hypothetical protein NP233_g11552 [Leucocoprinus birnbaumii]|uniref:Uncharacterized protein n=1 Tax=Leucocoprinus birnbaumii TaxID=56174 RepID=A0AAD5VG78_9AGAR|nr:hypothetical protein NP233_g11552 [Leucocoprinus birnbaumii]
MSAGEASFDTHDASSAQFGKSTTGAFPDPLVWEGVEGGWSCKICSRALIHCSTYHARRHESTENHQQRLQSHLRDMINQPEPISPPNPSDISGAWQGSTRSTGGALAQMLQEIAAEQPPAGGAFSRTLRQVATGLRYDYPDEDFAMDINDFLPPCAPDHEMRAVPESEHHTMVDISQVEGTLDLHPELLDRERISKAIAAWLEDTPPIVDSISDDELLEQDNAEVLTGGEPDHDDDDELEDGPEMTYTRRVRDGAGTILQQDPVWRPWRDRVSCILDILHHIPRSAFTESQMEKIVWALQVLGVPNVPSRSVSSSAESGLQQTCGINTIRYQGSLGNIYYANDIREIIAQEFRNPLVRPLLQSLPEERNHHRCEARHFARWRHKVDPDLATPMVRVDNQDFYVFEPALLINNTVCVPVRWFQRDGNIWADTWRLTPSAHRGVESGDCSGWIVHEYHTIQVPLSSFVTSFPYLCSTFHNRQNFPDPRKILGRRTSSGSQLLPWDYTNPLQGNRWRQLAKGKRVESFPIWLYCDDTSGNTSKRWNKHNSFLFTPAGIPHSHAHLEYHVHFLSTSNISPPLEMLEGIAEQIRDGQLHGIWSYDCIENEDVLVIPWILAILGDNPMQSELSCHIGLHGKFFCRCCEVKGKDGSNTREKEKMTFSSTQTSQVPEAPATLNSDESTGEMTDGSGTSTHALTNREKGRKRGGRKEESAEQMISRVVEFLKISTPRSKSNTLLTLHQIFQHSKTPGEKTKAKRLKTENGVKDTFQEHFLLKLDKFIKTLPPGSYQQKQEQIDQFVKSFPEHTVSPMWRIQEDLNPHSDTPVEILHVILLGFVKYFWRDACSRLNTDTTELVITRLNSLRVSGLNISSIPGRTLVKYNGSLTGRDFRLVAQVAPLVLYNVVPENCYNAWRALSDLVTLVWQPSIDDLDSYVENLQATIQNFLLATVRWSPRWFNKPKFHILLHLPDHIRRFGPAILFATESFESFNAQIRSLSVASNRQAPSRDIALGFALKNRVRHLLSGGLYQESQAEMEEARPRSTGWLSPGSGPARLIKTEKILQKTFGFLNFDLETPKKVDIAFTKESPSGAIPWEKTEASRLTDSLTLSNNPDLFQYRCCKSCNLDSGDECTIRSFVVVSDGSAATSSRIICEVIEILWIAEPYRLQSLSPAAGHCSLVHHSNVLCVVNVQHNCYQNQCKPVRTRRVMQERELREELLTEEIQHTEPNDLILNTGQMRSSAYLQAFRSVYQALPITEIQQIVAESVLLEIEKQKGAQAVASGSGTHSSLLRVSNQLRPLVHPQMSSQSQAPHFLGHALSHQPNNNQKKNEHPMAKPAERFVDGLVKTHGLSSHQADDLHGLAKVLCFFNPGRSKLTEEIFTQLALDLPPGLLYMQLGLYAQGCAQENRQMDQFSFLLEVKKVMEDVQQSLEQNFQLTQQQRSHALAASKLALVDPSIPSYGALDTSVMSFLKEKKSTYSMTTIFGRRPRELALERVVRVHCRSVRSQFKEHISTSIQKCVPLSEFASLMQKFSGSSSMEVTPAFIARLAILRRFVREYGGLNSADDDHDDEDELNDSDNDLNGLDIEPSLPLRKRSRTVATSSAQGKGKDRTRFWRKVDSLLADKHRENGDQLSSEKWKKYIEECIHLDEQATRRLTSSRPDAPVSTNFITHAITGRRQSIPDAQLPILSQPPNVAPGNQTRGQFFANFLSTEPLNSPALSDLPRPSITVESEFQRTSGTGLNVLIPSRSFESGGSSPMSSPSPYGHLASLNCEHSVSRAPFLTQPSDHQGGASTPYYSQPETRYSNNTGFLRD